MQVVNANKAVAKLEVSTDGGSTWQSTSRQEYNFFENSSGFGTATVDVKVTSADGQAVIVKDVPVNSGASVTAGSNFGGSSGNSDDKSSPVAAAPTSSPAATTTPTAPTVAPEPVEEVETPTTTPATPSAITEAAPSVVEEPAVAAPEPIVLAEVPVATPVASSPATEVAPSTHEAVVTPQPTAASIKTPCANPVTVVVTVTASF